MGSTILVDTNILLDVLTADPVWLAWSSKQLKLARKEGPVVINPIVCAEIAPAFEFDWARLDKWLLPALFIREGLPFESSVRAAEAFSMYRRAGGTRTSPLPDFYIGAHAEAKGYQLLTRDPSRYQTYFPKVPLLSPPASDQASES